MRIRSICARSARRSDVGAAAHPVDVRRLAASRLVRRSSEPSITVCRLATSTSSSHAHVHGQSSGPTSRMYMLSPGSMARSIIGHSHESAIMVIERTAAKQ